MTTMAARQLLAAALSVIPLVASQQIGTTPEAPPSINTWKCTTSGGCAQQQTSIVLDWNYHWIHQTGTSQSCTTSSGVNSTLCPDEATCSKNCVIEGANYTAVGVDVSGDSMTLHQYVQSNGAYSNSSPRVYLLGADEDYAMLQLLGQEISFDVDASNLPCGENGALYLSQMDKTGGRTQYNPGGAEYGSGYCDAQCPVQTWSNGTLNTNGSGYCCNEMDLWEANGQANAFTPHPCNSESCDKSGCGFNAYGQGQESYYGPGLTVDTTKPFTVTTQFLTSDGTTSGTLTEIRRLYVQNGKVIPNAVSTSGADSITESWCLSQDSGASTFGGLPTMGDALGAGMVLVFSIWNDGSQYMNWLDSGSAGPCSSTAGNPATILANDPTTYVTFSNIKWGDINSTYTGGGGGGGTTTTTTTTTSKTSTTTSTTTTTHTTTTTTTSTGAGPTQTHWGQCGGNGWKGPTVCGSPYKCQVQNPWYSQCL